MKTFMLTPKNLFPRLLVSLMFVCYPFTVLVAAEPTVTLEGELSELLQTPNNPGLKTRDSHRADAAKPNKESQLFDVEVVLRMPPGRPPACGSGSVSVQDGTVARRMLNGKIASEDDLAQAQSNCENRLFEYLSERETIREQRYQQLMAELVPMMNKSYNAQHQLRHAQTAGNRGSVSAVRLKLTGAEIKAFATQQGDMAEAIRPYREPVAGSHCGDTPSWTADEIGLSDHTFLLGIGVGIYMTEANGCPANVPHLNLPVPYGLHGDQVHQVLSAAAPGAHIFCEDRHAFYPNSFQLDSENIFISTHSWFDPGASPTNYNSMDRTWDRRVYNTKAAIFFIAGNTAASVTTPGKAFNVITVGGTDPNGICIRSAVLATPIRVLKNPKSWPPPFIGSREMIALKAPAFLRRWRRVLLPE